MKVPIELIDEVLDEFVKTLHEDLRKATIAVFEIPEIIEEVENNPAYEDPKLMRNCILSAIGGQIGLLGKMITTIYEAKERAFNTKDAGNERCGNA